MFKAIPKNTREEILLKVKNGEVVSALAAQYGISDKTIYGWLRWQVTPKISFMEVARLRRENEELKRIIGIITLELERGKKIAIVKQVTNKKLIAKAMSFNHKNMYFKSRKETKDLKVKEEIEKTFVKNPAYGHRRLALELKMNKKKILRIMHKFKLKPPRLWYRKKFLTESDPRREKQFTNLLKDLDLRKYSPGQIWSTDLTYLKFEGKFMYLAVIKDIIGKEIVAFNLSDRHDSDLVLKTLKEAVLKAEILPLIFHSDRGKEYLSQSCISFLESLGIKISVSDPGSPWQNGWSESFFSIFKTESGDLNRFENLGELIEYIYGYLHYYNNDRIQLELKMSPEKYKQSLRKCS